MTPRHEHHALAERQHGLLTLADLDLCGVTRKRRRTLVAKGELVPVHPGVFRIGGSPATHEQRILSASLHRGAPAGFRTAAWLHRVPGFGVPGEIELLARRPAATAEEPGVVVHSTTWLPSDDVVTVRGISTVGVARTVLSLCALVPDELSWLRVKRAVDDACQLDLASDDWLWWRLERLRRSGRNGVRVMAEILRARAEGDVTESWLEAASLRLFKRAGLPEPVCQARFERQGSFVARVDFLFAAANLVVEVNGHRPHRTRAQIQRDAERTRALVLAGHRVLTFTYDDVVRHPQTMIDEIAAALHLQPTA